MRRLIALLLLLGTVAPLRAQTAWARVTYLSGASVYVDAGSKDGLKEGSALEVVRGGDVVAKLVVAFVSSSRVSCTIASSTSDPAVGDSVRYIADRPMPPTLRPDSSQSGSPGEMRIGDVATTARRPGYLRGRLGVRYLVVDPGAGSGGSLLTQPAFDVRLDGQHVGGSPLGLVVDIRAQRSTFVAADTLSSTPAPANVTRVYQAALQWSPVGSPTRLTLGRQFATALSTIGLFDGAAIDIDGRHWSVGALAGLQPEPINLGISTEVRQYGAYVQAHNAPGTNSLWSLTLGGVGAYDNGEIDREFLYLRATYTGRHLSLFAAQELDVNRGWRSTVEGSATTPTSTFAIVNVSVTDWLGINGGVDNRRNVRLYRDYVNPESVFDDTFREGIWGGASVSMFRRVRVAVDARSSSGGSAGTLQSVTGTLSVTQLTPLQIGLWVRSTQFTGQLTAGTLQSASLDVTPFGAMRLEFTAGQRNSALPADGSPAPRLVWTSIDADIGIGRAVYLILSMSRDTGTLDHNVQSYAALSYRF